MEERKNKKTIYNIIDNSLSKAFRGGLSGGIAMGINVCLLMPLRTTVNYQYRYGGDMIQSINNLYKDGRLIRFYRGFGFAIIQGPWSRFGDTFANTGTITLLNSFDETKNLNITSKTFIASASASLFRVISTPLDTCKTILQVEGKDGLLKLKYKFKHSGGFPKGIPIFWYGALGSASATFVGHYPWFLTFNYLQQHIPEQNNIFMNISKNAFIGFSASAVSDTCSNSIRVLKTYRQTNQIKISYINAIKEIIKNDGIYSLLGRGLKTKIISNGIQGAIFSVLWKMIEKKLSNNE